MKKYLKGLFAFAIMLFPMMVNAKSMTGDVPVYDEKNNIFIANGTPIVIEEENGNTYVTWEGGNKQLVNSETSIVGGYHNPCDINSADGSCDIDLSSVSITMNGGSVRSIIAGNQITADYAKYSKIHVDNIQVTVNGGILNGIFGLTDGRTALGSSYYEIINEYYTADNVKIDINNAVVGYVISTSSYTYIDNYEVNVNNSTLTDSIYALSMGSNGRINSAKATVINSNVKTISAGNRAMINTWNLDISGNSVIGDIYAGSYYPYEETALGSNNWKGFGIGGVDYGQVGEMKFNIGESVIYNNIYAGFQFVDKELFEEIYATNIANGNGAFSGIINSEVAKVIIDAHANPMVDAEDSKVSSMFDDKYTNVTVIANYLKVDEAIDKAKAIDISLYTEESVKVLNDAINAVVRGLDKDYQTEVDAMADVINSAINELVYKSADYTEVNEAIEKAEAIDKTLYTKESLEVLADAINSVDTNKNITEQEEVDAMADAIVSAINTLVYKSADYTEVNEAIEKAEAIDKTLYTEESLEVLYDALDSVILDFNITRQEEVDAMALAIIRAIDGLVLKPEEIPEVPQTYDGFVPTFAIIIISLNCLFGTVIYLKKKNKSIRDLFVESL